MEKLDKKLQLNKQVVASLNQITGGEPTKTWKCKTNGCAPVPGQTVDCNSQITIKDGCGGDTWDTEFTCTPSNGETCGPTDTYVTCPCGSAGC